jgi:hypothetical protein
MPTITIADDDDGIRIGMIHAGGDGDLVAKIAGQTKQGHAVITTGGLCHPLGLGRAGAPEPRHRGLWEGTGRIGAELFGWLAGWWAGLLVG